MEPDGESHTHLILVKSITFIQFSLIHIGMGTGFVRAIVIKNRGYTLQETSLRH
jgi:hypothetical protein